jgi:hypothetical protein
LLRFTVPFVAVGTDLLFNSFMENEYNASEAAITTAKVQVEEISAGDQTPQVSDRGLFERMKAHAAEFWSQAATNVDIGARYEHLTQAAERWTEHIVKLIVIYLMQTMVIPILLLWILYALTRALFTTQGRKVRE